MGTRYSAVEIEDMEIRKSAFGGYNREEVDVLLDDVAEDYVNYDEEIKRLELVVAELNEKLKIYEGVENSVQDVLRTAQKAAEDVRRAADEKAESIIKSAQLRAQEETLTVNELLLKKKLELETVKGELNELFLRIEKIK